MNSFITTLCFMLNLNWRAHWIVIWAYNLQVITTQNILKYSMFNMNCISIWIGYIIIVLSGVMIFFRQNVLIAIGIVIPIHLFWCFSFHPFAKMQNFEWKPQTAEERETRVKYVKMWFEFHFVFDLVFCTNLLIPLSLNIFHEFHFCSVPSAFVRWTILFSISKSTIYWNVVGYCQNI